MILLPDRSAGRGAQTNVCVVLYLFIFKGRSEVSVWITGWGNGCIDVRLSARTSRALTAAAPPSPRARSLAGGGSARAQLGTLIILTLRGVSLRALK